MSELITTDPAWYYLGLISGAALLMTYFTFLMSGLARMRFKVPAPSHDGPEEYLRYVRAHQNTIEHLIMYLPGMWLFALAVSPFWAAVIGAAWPVARVFYALGYYRSADARRLPLYISMPIIYTFLLGSPIGFIIKLI